MEEEEELSTDSFSIASLEVTTKRSLASRKFNIPITDIGRQVKPTAFVFCLLSLLMLSSGLVLVAGSIWVIISRYKYNIVTHQPIFDLSDISIFGGILNIPCFWITCMSHENRRNFVLLPFLIFCIMLSMLMLIIGSTSAIMNRMDLITGFTSKHVQSHLKSGTFHTVLKYRMISSMESYYGNNIESKSKWDFIQRSLDCCGVSGPNDWMKFNQSVPLSCDNQGILRESGCLELIAVKLAEQIDVSAGLALITLTVQVCSILLVSHAYYRNRKLLEQSTS